jgi:L-seryl-tRNA(Ser) seleniumtransferase
MLSRTPEELNRRAVELCEKLAERGISATVIETESQCGGGSLPDLRLQSYAVKLTPRGAAREERSKFSEKVFKRLLLHDTPVLGILREGELMFDMRTIDKIDVGSIVEAVYTTITGLK